jgi:Fic family protein
MSTDQFYRNVSQMEPMLPSPIPKHLAELAIELTRQSGALGSILHPFTRIGVIELLREMNCYYSNLIEGHKTHPLDIQRALKQDFSQDPAKRALQLESVAHIQVQKLIEEQLHTKPETLICSSEFLSWIHHAFYSRLPDSLKIISNAQHAEEHVVAGELRNRAVIIVGSHIPPHHTTLEAFLKRFADVYTPKALEPIQQIIAVAASHHRLAWIHPFLDGNGRVVRLFSDAYLRQIRLDGHGLWTMARGLARHRARYMQALAMADSSRQGDLDGRGNLSQKGLIDFCQFFLETALDQVQFMESLLNPTFLKKRIERFVQEQVDRSQLKPEAVFILQAVLLNGELSRGEATQAAGMSERSGRDLLKTLLTQELLVSTSPKGPVRLGFPIFAVEHYFPNLYMHSENSG